MRTALVIVALPCYAKTMDPDADPFEQAEVIRGNVSELINQAQVAKDAAKADAERVLDTVGGLVLASGAGRAGLSQIFNIGTRAAGKATEAVGDAAEAVTQRVSAGAQELVSNARGGLSNLADRATALIKRGSPQGEEEDPESVDPEASVAGRQGESIEMGEMNPVEEAPAATSVAEAPAASTSAEDATTSVEDAGGDAASDAAATSVEAASTSAVEGTELLAGAEAGPIGLAIGAVAAIGTAIGLAFSHHHSESKEVVTAPTLNPL